MQQQCNRRSVGRWAEVLDMPVDRTDPNETAGLGMRPVMALARPVEGAVRSLR